MNHVLQRLTWEICLIYLDDIIIFSSTFDEHLSRLRCVFDRLHSATLNPQKCFLVRSSVCFLGHIVSKDGIRPNPEKIQLIRDFSRPRKVKDVQAFIGLASYYRRFVKNFATIALPLTHLTRKNVNFQWDETCQTAFDQLKSLLTTAPILASADGLGYLLGQVIDGKEVVIAYGGRQLNRAEQNYSTTEREALAVVDGIRKYHVYLYGKKFFVHTDHHALKWLMDIKDPTGKLARWALQLQHHDFDIIHRPGKSHGNADALSRLPYPQVQLAAIDSPGVQIDLINYLESNQLPHDDHIARTFLLQTDDFYQDDNNLLCHIWYPGKRRAGHLFTQLVIAVDLRHEILTHAHDDATSLNGMDIPTATTLGNHLKTFWTSDCGMISTVVFQNNVQITLDVKYCI